MNKPVFFKHLLDQVLNVKKSGFDHRNNLVIDTLIEIETPLDHNNDKRKKTIELTLGKAY